MVQQLRERGPLTHRGPLSPLIFGGVYLRKKFRSAHLPLNAVFKSFLSGSTVLASRAPSPNCSESATFPRSKPANHCLNVAPEKLGIVQPESFSYGAQQRVHSLRFVDGIRY